MNKDTLKALDAVSADSMSVAIEIVDRSIPKEFPTTLPFSWAIDAVLEGIAYGATLSTSTQQAAKSAAASAEQLVDGTSPDILDEGGTLVYFSRAAVLKCV